MRNLLLLGLLIAAIIYIYLSFNKSSKETVSLPGEDGGKGVETLITDLPDQMEKKMTENLRKGQERTEKIMREIEE